MFKIFRRIEELEKQTASLALVVAEAKRDLDALQQRVDNIRPLTPEEIELSAKDEIARRKFDEGVFNILTATPGKKAE